MMQEVHHFLESLRDVFQFEDWCPTLYEQDLRTMSSSAFGNRLLTAASRFDSRQKRPTSQTVAYHTLTERQASEMHSAAESKLTYMVAAFFSKTPPPPHNRLPFRFRSYFRSRPPRPWYRNGRPPAALRRQTERRCYGCEQPGYILRNCPEKAKYTHKLNRLYQAGTGANLIIEHMEDEPSDNIEDIVNFVNDYLTETEDEDDHSELDAWICDLMDITDDNSHLPNYSISQEPTQGSFHSSLDAFTVKISIHDLEKAMQELMTDNVQDITEQLLTGLGAPRSLCSETCLETSLWSPVKKLSLPTDMHPFSFAGHPIFPKYAVCLAAQITDFKGNSHILRQIVFVLPPTPIPFLVRLQIQRQLSFDLCMREGTDSHLKIQQWQSIHNLVVNSHV